MFTPICRLVGHSADVVRGRISPDCETIATGSADKSLILWDAVTGDAIRVFENHTREVTDVSFHSVGDGVYTSSMDGLVRLFDLRSDSNSPVLTFGNRESEVTCIGVGNGVNSGLLVSGSSTGTLLFYDVRKQQSPLVSSFAHYDTICSIEVSSNDALAVSSSLDTTMRVWSTNHCDCLLTVDSGTSNPSPCVYGGFTADQSGLIGLFLNSSIQRWELSDRVYCKQKIIGPQMKSSTKTFTRIQGTNEFAVPSEDGKVYFMSFYQKTSPPIKAHADDVLSVDSRNSLLVSTGAGEDSSAVIWRRTDMPYTMSYNLVAPQIEGLV